MPFLKPAALECADVDSPDLLPQTAAHRMQILVFRYLLERSTAIDSGGTGHQAEIIVPRIGHAMLWLRQVTEQIGLTFDRSYLGTPEQVVNQDDIQVLMISYAKSLEIAVVDRIVDHEQSIVGVPDVLSAIADHAVIKRPGALLYYIANDGGRSALRYVDDVTGSAVLLVGQAVVSDQVFSRAGLDEMAYRATPCE